MGEGVLRLVLAAVLACVAPLAPAQGESAKTPADASAERPIAGKVVLVEGDVRVYDRNQGLRRPKLDDSLYEGDSVVTGDGGEVHFDMEDGGYIGVRPNTRMRIANYKAEGGPDDQSVISLLQGSFRSITGWIGRLGGDHYRVVTRTVTIGVRGTEHEPHVIPEGGTVGEPGTYDRVHNGETVMQTPKGTVNIRANQAGFMPLRGEARPRVLDRIPAFFRPTRNEGRFQGLHLRVQQQLQQRRQQRIQQIQERRKQAGLPREQRQRALQDQQRRLQMQKQQQEKREARQAPERRKEEKAQSNRAEKQRQIQERREAAERARKEHAKKPEERRKHGEREHPRIPARE
ncbi:MAG: hypothetical protein E6H56_14910 [Betaproteobacteria bacterium]|nr:MAG: hypothetical protein E6H56_14910 [Betaproteobacteria bacterium]